MKKNKLSDFKKIINFEISQRGDFENLNYKPTFKASAIFYFVCNNTIDTKISFLNYWNIKNHNKDVSCLITLRSDKGEKILRTFLKLKENTYTFSIKKILQNKIRLNDISGSVNIELFSSYDLKFIYPAIDAIYETSHGVSLVHSNQRILDDIIDNKDNQSLNQTQTGFDIYCDEFNYSYVVAINGPLELLNKELDIKFFNSKGKSFTKKFKFKKISPYEVIKIDLDKIKKLKKFFQSSKGFCKINLPTENIFNRVLVATVSRDKKKITTTHSYYDCSNVKDFVTFDKPNSQKYNCFIPFNIIKDIDLDIVIYPIFSKSNLAFDLEMVNRNKEHKIIQKNVLNIEKNFSKSITLPIKNFLKQINNPTENLYFLNIRSKNNKIPSRMTYGFNYKQKSFGSNISDAMIVNRPGKTRRSKSKGFYWGPVFHSKNISSVIALSSLLDDSSFKDQKLILKIYNNKKIVLKQKFNIKNKESKTIHLDNLLKNIKKSEDQVLWFTLESSLSKNLICKHVHKSKFGHISADHSF
tara:strand:- start:24763 stop:26340 length:1578 start_codon:yes stop_codon:yes gene_type:complete